MGLLRGIVKDSMILSNAITRVLNWAARRFHGAGEPGLTPVGTLLGGTYPSGHWCCGMETQNDEDLEHFLVCTAAILSPAKDF
jgi:hypothetical protein